MTTYAAIEEGAGANAKLFVVERLARGGRISDGDAADYVRDAGRIAELEHPNIVRVREVGIRADEVLVASDFIDGEPLEAMLNTEPATRASLEVLLRIIVDVLTGLGALHNLRDVKRVPLKLVHGELTPSNVVVGLDGSARLVQVCRVAALATRPGRTGAGYLAPEVLLADGSADARADVYSAGVLLWEALSGRRMLQEAPPHAIVAHILSGRIVHATPPVELAWANDLIAVAHKALSADPNGRFANAAAMAAEIRRVAGARLATTGKVSLFAKHVFGAKVAARRQALLAGDGSVVTANVTAKQAQKPAEPPPEPPRVALGVSPDEVPQTRTTTKPPPPMEDGFEINLEDSTVSDRETAVPGLVAAAAIAKAPAVPAIAAPTPAAPAIAAPTPAAPTHAIAPPAPARAVPAPIAVAPAPPAPIAVAPAPPAPIAVAPAPIVAAAPPAPIAVAPAPVAVASAPAAIAPFAAVSPPSPVAAFAPSPFASAPAESFAQDDVRAVSPTTPVIPPADDVPYTPPRRPRWIVPVVIAVPLFLLLSWGGCRMLSRSEPPRDVASSAPVKPTSTAATTTTPATTPVTTATATAAATATQTATATTEPAAATAPPATAIPSPETATAGPHTPPAVPSASSKPTAKPRPTYDPQGI